MRNSKAWLESLTTDSQNEAARRAGIPERTFYNQLAKNSLSAENIIKLSQAYDSHPLRALIENGYIDQSWASIGDVEEALRAATPEQLADEMLRRIEEAESLADQAEEDLRVFQTPIDDLAERRGPSATPDVVPHLYAADSSEDEPEEGDDDYGGGA